MPDEMGKPPSGITNPGRRKVLQPTVIDIPKAETRPPKTKSAKKPTVISGVERKPIEVSVTDLKILNPGSAKIVCEKAQQLIATVVVSRIKERHAVMWGYTHQQSYVEIVNQTLVLSQNKVLRKVREYLNRTVEILSNLDLLAVSGHKSAVFGGLTKKIDTSSELSSAQIELNQLVELMSQSMNDLLELREQFEFHVGKIGEVSVEVEASALAALFLAQHLQSENVGLASRFTDRAMSLTQTVAQIRADKTIVSIQVDQPLRLISAIQDVALVTLPGFIGSLASVVILAESKTGMTPTEVGEINHRLRDIVSKL